jgi:7-carboxy-7-deazaguanine synthase
MSSNDFLINDIFHTFQGEGLNWGKRALFIRMPYCNLKCSWCDTEFNSFKRYQKFELLDIMDSERTRFAVITGGEPMMNKQTPYVIKELKSRGFVIATETNGTYPIVDGIDFVTVSPKKDAQYKVHDDAFKKAHEFKYVVDEDFDFEILKRHNVFDGRRYSLSPEFNNFEKQVKVIQDFIIDNPHWRLNLQTHKWIGIK